MDSDKKGHTEYLLSYKLFFWKVIKRPISWLGFLFLLRDIYKAFIKSPLPANGQGGVAMPLGLGIALFALMLLIAAAKTYHEQRMELVGLKERLSPKLDMFFDADDPSCIKTGSSLSPFGTMGRFPHTLFRVKVRNLSGVTIGKVRVVLDKIEPGSFQHGIRPLRFLNDNSEDYSLSRDGINLDPEAVEYVNVVENMKAKDISDKLMVHVAPKEFPCSNCIEAGRYVFSLTAHGVDVQPYKKSYVVYLNEDGSVGFEDKN